MDVHFQKLLKKEAIFFGSCISLVQTQRRLLSTGSPDLGRAEEAIRPGRQRASKEQQRAAELGRKFCQQQKN